jgi:plastocyanin
MNARMTLACAAWAVALTACLPRKQSEPVVSATDAGAIVSAMQSVRGVVRYSGPDLLPARIELPTGVQKVCGQTLERPVLSLKGGKIAGVVVFADLPASVHRDRVLPTATLDQRGCDYRPSVLAATTGSTLAVLNSDPLIHNVRAVGAGPQTSSTLFNVAMPLEGMTLRRRLDAPGVVNVRCDVHPWMSAQIRVFEHESFTVTGEDGSFSLEVPVGTQKVHFWHPRLAPQVRDLSSLEKDSEVLWDSVIPL